MKIKFENISFSFGVKRIIDQLSFDIESGQITGIVGISGSGKSTMLKLVAGIHKPTSGNIFFNNSKLDLDNLKKNVSFIFQESTLLPWKTVYQNIEVSRHSSSSHTTHEICKLVGLENHTNLFPSQLSGGMKQRVEFGRLLGRPTRIILMDEPFSNLDMYYRKHMIELFLEIQTLKKATSILVSHNIQEIIKVARFVKVIIGSPISKVLEFDLYNLNRETAENDIRLILLNEFNKSDKRK